MASGLPTTVEIAGQTLSIKCDGQPPDASRPLILLVPGMGDTKEQFRFFAPAIARRLPDAAVISLDPRGQGASDVDGWGGDFSAAATGRDIVAILDQFCSNDRAVGAVLIGNSAGAAASEWAAAERPAVVRGLVLLGPFGRHIHTPWYMRGLLRALLAKPWGAGQWASYYVTLYPKERQPPDLNERAAALSALMRKEPARLTALKVAIFASKADCAARLLEVKVPAVIIMGSADPDFTNPAAEARTLAALFPKPAAAGDTGGVSGGGVEVVMAEGSGHYPHAETADAEPALSAALGLIRRACPAWRVAD